MAWDAHDNFGKGTLTNAPGTSGTSFILGTGEGANFSVNQPVTIAPPNVQPDASNAEIGYVTAVSTDTLTVTRAQQGTSAIDAAIGDMVYGTITTKALTDIETEVDLKAPLASPTFTGTVSGITKSMVGLGNVDNTSDATKNSATATLTNKTLTDPKINQIDDTNGNASINVSATASAVNYIDVINASAGFAPSIKAAGSDPNITLYMAGKGTGSLVMADSSGKQIIEGTGVSSAVNYVTATNAATGNAPVITATGSDTNVSLNLATKGTGTVKANNVDVATTTGTQTLTNKTITDPQINQIKSTSGGVAIGTFAAGTAVNYVQLNGGDTGASVGVEAKGTDTNIDIDLVPKGSGRARVAGERIVTTIGTQTLTNKTMSTASNTISNPYKFSVARNSAANTGNGAFAKITFDTELYDTNNNFSSGTYTVPVAGYYMISAGFAAASSATNQRIIVSIYKNGSETKRLATSWSSAASQALFVSGSILMELAASDTLDVYAFGTTTFALDVSTTAIRPYFSGYLVSHT